MAANGDNGWVRVLGAFDEVVSLDAPARQTRLAEIGASEPELQRALEELLAADTSADQILERFDAVLSEPAQEIDPLHLTGRTISHFRVIEPLARGGMGVVYRAEDVQLGRPIALKVPLAARYLDPAAVERFRREARAAAALDHPNLCQVYETGETADGDLFYTMPLYVGETLKTRLAREARLPLDQAVEIAAQLTHGLGAAHHAGVVHRDLKPANVMLLPDGAVKILDFGLAKASDVSLTVSWARLGTIAYMAPEQVRGHEVDPRADLWALGVVLYEMVTGMRPFRGGHEIGVAHAILHEEAPRASALRDEIPAELDRVIHTCLKRDPAHRYQSADDLAAALGGIQLDQGSPLTRKVRRARVIVARHPKWRVAMIVVTAMLVAAAGAMVARRGTTGAPVSVSLAVLPFDWRGDSTAMYHLAVGLSDGIGTAMGRLRSVVTPSYVTTSIYRNSDKSPKQIGAELQAGALLRGSVQRVDDRVRVDAQLFDSEGNRLWAQRYERPSSEITAIQRDIERATVSTLRIRPTQGERGLLDRPATTNGRAYDTYLQGRAIDLAGQPREPFRSMATDNIRRAMSLYSRARDLDPDFATARARLALMHTLAATTYDTTESRREQARVEAEIALRLRPGLPEAHEALASYWNLKKDPAKAVEEQRLAIDAFPNSGDLRLALGDILQQAGRSDEALSEVNRAAQLEPASPKAAAVLATSYGWMRRREEAMRAFDRAIALAPEYPMIKVIKGHSYLRWKGTADTLAAIMESIPPDWDPNGMATYSRYTALMVQRRWADGLAMLKRSGSELSSGGYFYLPTSLMSARFYEGVGDRRMARASYIKARSILEDSVTAHPADPIIRTSLAFTYAGLGRTTDALREVRRATEQAPIASRSADASVVLGGAAEVFAKVGDIDAALEVLELLLSMPAGRDASVPLLRAWPGFDPLRNDPRFEALLVRFAHAR